MKTALIFGANGFVGTYLAREFATHGYRIAASDISDTPRDTLECDCYRPCNLLDGETLVKTVNEIQPDAIINLAAISSVGQSWKMPQKTIEVNVVGTLNILEAARLQQVMPKVLLIGSSEEYAPSDTPLNENSPLLAGNPYGVSKSTQERFADIYSERFDMSVYRIRSFNHTGIGQTDTFVLPSFCKQVARIGASGGSGKMLVGNLSVRRDFSDVRDIVRAYRMLIESDYSGEVFNIGSGVAHSLKELLESIISNCEQEVNIEVDPSLLRPSDNPIICCDNTKAARLLGWIPEYRIEDTLQEMYVNCLETLAV